MLSAFIAYQSPLERASRTVQICVEISHHFL